MQNLPGPCGARLGCTLLIQNFCVHFNRLWYREDVQRFLDLVLATGPHDRIQWNEQAVIGMAWHFFCPFDNSFG
jgi:hypothetical protein